MRVLPAFATPGRLAHLALAVHLMVRKLEEEGLIAKELGVRPGQSEGGWINDRDRESLEVACVEGEQLSDGVSSHGGDEARIVRPEAADA